MIDPTYEQVILGVDIESDDILVLTLGGNLLADTHKEALEGWVEKGKSAITALKEKTGREVLCITDVSAVKTFDDGAIDILKGFADWPESHKTKTAVVGGSLFSKMALRTIVLLTGRKNLRPFATKEEALAWLHDNTELGGEKK